jgi:hypothetical protein
MSHLTDAIQSKAESEDYLEFKTKVMGQLAGKVESSELNQAVRGSQSELTSTLAGLKTDLKRTFTKI